MAARLFTIRPAVVRDSAALLAIRRDAIMGLAQEYGRAEAERWANAPHVTAERVAHAIEVHHVWVAEDERSRLGWIEVRGSTVQSLYVRDSESGTGIGTRLMERGERCIAESGHRSADLEASPNAEPFYRKRGYSRAGENTSSGAIPMKKPLEPAA